MAIVSGHLFTDNGQMTCADGTAGVPTTNQVLGGWAHKHTSEPYVEDIGATTVAATSMSNTVLRLGGLAFHPDGRLLVTTQAIAAADQYFGALRVRDDGALRVNTTSVSINDAYNGGWAFTSNGQARMSIT